MWGGAGRRILAAGRSDLSDGSELMAAGRAGRDPRALVGEAYARVDRGDWSRWTPHPADPVAMLPTAPYLPPLTRGMVAAFVRFQWWLMGRPPDLFQYQAWEQRLQGAWLMSDRDARGVRDVLATLMLAGELLRLSPRRRESIRGPLRQVLWEGSARPETLSWGPVEAAPSWGPPEAVPPPPPEAAAGPVVQEPAARPAAEQRGGQGKPSPQLPLKRQFELDAAHQQQWLTTMDTLHKTFMDSLYKR